MIESHQARFGIAAQPAPARHRQQLDLERLGNIRGRTGEPVINRAHDRIEAGKGSGFRGRPPHRLGVSGIGDGEKRDSRCHDERRAQRAPCRAIAIARSTPLTGAHSSTPGL